MLFRFSANLSFGEVFDLRFVGVYFTATLLVYVITTIVALWRRISAAEAAVEAQCGAIGNIGFLGIPMFALIMGEAAVGYIMVMLAVDLLFFGSLIVIVITASQGQRFGPGAFRDVGRGLITNPLLVAIFLGFAWSATGWQLPEPANAFVTYLGGAAMPGGCRPGKAQKD